MTWSDLTLTVEADAVGLVAFSAAISCVVLASVAAFTIFDIISSISVWSGGERRRDLLLERSRERDRDLDDFRLRLRRERLERPRLRCRRERECLSERVVFELLRDLERERLR